MKNNSIHNQKIKERINLLKSSLSNEINLNSIEAIAPIAFKWKCLYKIWSIRELVLHRITDLLDGAENNQKEYSHIVSVILFRAAYETIAILCYLNNLMHIVASNQLNCFEFDKLLNRLLLGDKSKYGEIEPINIMGAIKKTDEKYNGFLEAYESLCEKAHPNYMGLLNSYARNHKDGIYTIFEKQSSKDNTNYLLINLSLDIFEKEYNEVWEKNYKKLIKWMEDNDSKLERERNKRSKKKNCN